MAEQINQVTIVIDGKRVVVPLNKLSAMIKKRILQSKSIMHLFEEFEISPDRLDDLIIEVADLKQKYAETDLKRMRLNRFMFERGDFFEEYFFVVAHEIIHWLTRVKEQDGYLYDPEEVLGFCSSIAYEMERGTDPDIIWNRIYPKISYHFHNETDARRCFVRMIEKAKEILHKTEGDSGVSFY